MGEGELTLRRAVDASDACTRPRQMRLRLRLLIPHFDRPGRSHSNLELFLTLLFQTPDLLFAGVAFFAPFLARPS